MNRPVAPVWLKHAAQQDACSRRADPATPCSVCGAKQFNVCQPLEPQRQAEMLSIATRLSWGRREALFAAGEPARHVYNVTEGMVSLSRSLADGRRQIFGFVLPGDFIGLESTTRYTFDAESLTEVKACRFERASFDRFMGENVDVALRMVSIASNDLAQASQHEVLLGRKTAVERVATFLLDLKRRAGTRRIKTEPLALPMTRTEIADYTGLTIETVSRVFGRLRSEAVIELSGSSAVRVLQEARLMALAESAEAAA
jgi:CRP/FNR family transcriptional regulator